MIDRIKNKTIILNEEDVNNPLHPNLWYSFLETLGVDENATEVCLKLSELDHNDRVKTVYFCPKCGWESFDDDFYETPCG